QQLARPLQLGDSLLGGVVIAAHVGDDVVIRLADLFPQRVNTLLRDEGQRPVGVRGELFGLCNREPRRRAVILEGVVRLQRQRRDRPASGLPGPGRLERRRFGWLVGVFARWLWLVLRLRISRERLA